MSRRFNKSSKEYLEFYRSQKTCFGGSLLKGNARSRRPIKPGQALHLVLRSSMAVGRQSFLRNHHVLPIKEIIRKQALHFGVRIYRFANSGNHLHLLVLPARERTQFIGFLRAISGLIARFILKSERGTPNTSGKFWDSRPFSRIVSFGDAFKRCARYLEKNVFEIWGFGGLDESVFDRRKYWNSA